MKDALKQTQHGLVRSAPIPLNPAAADKGEPSQETVKPPTPTNWRSTTRHRSAKREEWRWETKRARWANAVIRQRSAGVGARANGHPTSGRRPRQFVRTMGTATRTTSRTAPSSTVPLNVDGTETLQTAHRDEEAVKELAREEFEWEDDPGEQEEFSLPVHTTTGRVYRSFEEMLNDPTYPMPPITEPWLEEACTAEEMIKTYRVVATLDMKMDHVDEGFRQDIASAGWCAMLCIRNIYARIGDIVYNVWIERQRFVVIQLKSSEESRRHRTHRCRTKRSVRLHPTASHNSTHSLRRIRMGYKVLPFRQRHRIL